MTIRSRLLQLEKRHAPKVKKYMCVTNNPLDALDTPEEKAKGYKVQPYMVQAGGTGGEPFYFATRDELDQFAARDDVDLAIIRLGYRDDLPKNDQ